jgi:BirA family biotin operon repressor/biotin-[acetyl-CoA-carboxylase] ligase
VAIGGGRWALCERAAAAADSRPSPAAAAAGRGTGCGGSYSHAVTGLDADLRWPNDLLIGERKAVGILVESKIENGAAAFAVVGIGINVHQRKTSRLIWPRQPRRWIWRLNARVSRQDLLVSLLKSLEREARGLADPAAGVTIPERVAQASTWIRGRRVEVHGPQACTGITAGLDENGFLLVRTEDGLITVQTGGIRAMKSLLIDSRCFEIWARL